MYETNITDNRKVRKKIRTQTFSEVINGQHTKI